MNVKDIIIKPIKSQIAIEFVKKHHYSGRVVSNSQLHFGCFYENVLGGVMSFGPSMDKSKIQGLVKNTTWNGFIELNRMAFADWLPKNSESRCISVAMRLIKKHYPHIRWVISFADACQCGDGTIYRASGFDLRAVDILYNFNKPYLFKDQDKKYYSTFFNKVADDSELLYVCRYKKNDINTPDLIQLMPQGRILIKTGIRVAMPIIENEIMHIEICSRSGLSAKHGLFVLNAPGIVDNDFRGELGVVLYNAGHEPFMINIGDRIAQGIFNPLQQCIWQEVSQEDFDKNFCNTQRGNGGFGSTGK